MATSINSPNLSSAIRTDIPAINTILKALAKADPSILSDIENGTKRFYEGTKGWEFQELVSGSWVTRTKFNIDAQSVDGYNTSIDAVASTIVVRGTDKKIKGDLTGKADTAGTADKLVSTLAVNAGGTGATTATAARTNLGVPPTSHASASTSYGVGTDGMYGHVKLSDYPHADRGVEQGIALTPKGAATLKTELETELGEISTEVSTVREDTIAAALAAIQQSGGTVSPSPLPDPETVTHAMGEFWFTLDGTIPAGGLPHIGHLCSRATYGDFWTWREAKGNVLTDEEWLTYADEHGGVCPYYSYGDGSTTFRTPKYDEAFLKVVAATANAGKYGEAGLPNITGSSSFFQKDYGYRNADNYNGALYQASNRSGSTDGSSGTDYCASIGFDASRSNPIYGNSDTVTPKNIGILVGVYAVGKLGVIGSTDAEALLAGMTTMEATKASVDASNFSPEGRSLLAGLGMPSGRYVDLTLGAVGTSYIAPANGWFYLQGKSTYSTGYVTISANGMSAIASAESNGYVSSIRPVRKGDVVEVIYASFAQQSFKFYYAEGEDV